MKRPLELLSILVLVTSTMACSSSDDGDDGSGDTSAGGDSATDTVQETTADTGEDPVDEIAEEIVDNPFPELPDTTPDPSCTTGSWVVQVRGTVEDGDGAPIQGAMVQPCVLKVGSDILTCLRPQDSHIDGEFRVNIPESNRCTDSITIRVLKTNDDFATMYCHVDVDSTAGGILTAADPLVLYATNPVTTLPPLGVETEERTVTFADGLAIDLVPSRFFGPSTDSGENYDALASARLDDIQGDICFNEGVAPFDGLYAFSPEGDVDGEGFPMLIPNSTDLSAGSQVDLLILGGLSTILADGYKVPEAEWYVYGTGEVSADGSVIEGDGLPYFAWFGYRAQ